MSRMRKKSVHKPLTAVLLLTAVFFVAAAVRFWQLGTPAEYIFDERYHVPAARLALVGDPQLFEWWHVPVAGEAPFDWLHPPAHKYVQALSLATFGDSAFAWRFPAAVFGLMVIALVGLIAWEIGRNKHITLLALIFAVCDGLLLVQSRVGMNDSMATAFLWLSLWLYIRYLKISKSPQTQSISRWLLLGVGVSLGVGLSTKWTLIPIWGMLVLYEVFRVSQAIELAQWDAWFRTLLSQLHWVVFSLLVTPLVVYGLFFLPLLLRPRGIEHFIELHQQIIQYHIHRDADHLYQATPLQWVLAARPTWYWRGQSDVTSVVSGKFINSTTERIYAQSNPLLAWLGLGAIVQMCFVVWQGWQKKAAAVPWSQLRLLAPLLLAYVGYIGMSSLSPRILFAYHYTLVSPLLSICLAFVLQPATGASKLAAKRMDFLRWSSITLIVACFLFWLPLWLGVPVSHPVVNRVYFALPSWR